MRHIQLILLLMILLGSQGQAQPRSGEALTPHKDIKEMLLLRKIRKYEVVVWESVSLGHFQGRMHETGYSYLFINDSVVRKKNLSSMEEDYFVLDNEKFFDYDIIENKRKPSAYFTIEKDSADYEFVYEFAVGNAEAAERYSYERIKRDRKRRITEYYKWDKWGLMSDLYFTFEYKGDSLIIERGYRQATDSLIPFRNIISQRTISKDKLLETVVRTTELFDPDLLANGELPRTVTKTTRKYDPKGRLINKEHYGQYSPTTLQPDIILKIEYKRVKSSFLSRNRL